MAIQEASSAPDTLRLTFTAPGDDPGAGRAQSYDLRRATAPLTDATFAAATADRRPRRRSAPARPSRSTSPAWPVRPPTTSRSRPPTRPATCRRCRTSPAPSTLIVPPSTITDLAALDAVAGASPGTITLAWTAPGADGKSGQASSYDLRLSTAPLTAGGFDAATPLTGLPAPAPAGTRETFAVTGARAGRQSTTSRCAPSTRRARSGGVSNIVLAMPARRRRRHAAGAGRRAGGLALEPGRQADRAHRLGLRPALAAARAHQPDRRRRRDGLGQPGAPSPTTPAWVIFDYGTRAAAQPVPHQPVDAGSGRQLPAGLRDPDQRRQAGLDAAGSRRGADRHASPSGTSGRAPVTYARYVRLYITQARPGGRHRGLRGDGRVRGLRAGAVDRRRPDLGRARRRRLCRHGRALRPAPVDGADRRHQLRVGDAALDRCRRCTAG